MRYLLAVALAILSLNPLAIADGNRFLPLWHVPGQDNDVYLLASVHLLRASDYPLPAAIYAVLDEAETVIMELDTDDLDPAETAKLVSELALIQGDADLATLLGDGNFERARAMAQMLDIPLDMLSQNEPWFAAISIEQLMLTRLGFEARLGVESHLTERAGSMGKEIRGLETLREQLQILDELPLAAQRSLFMKTLEESRDIGELMNQLISAWQNGDTERLAQLALENLRHERDLYEQLVIERNRNWTNQIALLLTDSNDYLVVVGALHLVGEHGLPALLDGRGFTVRQLSNGALP